jgi:hypothetical protein
VYKEVVNRIKCQSDEGSELAMKVLSFVFCARRQLMVDVFLHALAVEPDDTELDRSAFSEAEILLTVCAGLVVIDVESSTVRLVHYALRRYLEAFRQTILPTADDEIARACLTYLSLDVFGTGPCDDDESLQSRLKEFFFFLNTRPRIGASMLGRISSLS